MSAEEEEGSAEEVNAEEEEVTEKEEEVNSAEELVVCHLLRGTGWFWWPLGGSRPGGGCRGPGGEVERCGGEGGGA